MSKVLCITGMHRSGTSLTASWVQECGLQIHNGRLMGAGVGNKLGHFEDVDFVKLHSKYVLKTWPGSKNWIVKGSRRMDSLTRQSFLREATDLTGARNDKYAFWGWKDPRTVLFLDLWKELIPDLKCLLVWRDARDVVDSLVRRSKKSKHAIDKINTLRSVVVWRYYNQQILDYFYRYPNDTIVVNIRDIIRSDKEVVQAIVSKLGFDLRHASIDLLVKQDMLGHAPRMLYRELLMNIFQVGETESSLRKISLDL